MKSFALSKGFVLHSGNTGGAVYDNFYLADHAIAFDDLDEVSGRKDCGLTPAWRGIVWVCQIRNPLGTLWPITIDGKCRVWGNVLVAGDEDLMDGIEELYRRD